MSFQDLDLDISYETSGDRNNLLDKFYIPMLQKSKKYYRIAGFFSSSSLVVASRGIEGLIHNRGTMYLLISPELSDEDYEVLKKHSTLTDNSPVFKNFTIETMPHENIQALAWMLDNNLLKIKIVIPKTHNRSLFHQKVGIAYDEQDNIISFSGSINETASAWLNNIEEFKVFKSWIDGQNEYVTKDLQKFISYWNDQHKEFANVYNIPDAIKQQLISLKPRDIMDLNIMRRYRKEVKITRNKLQLFPHQKNAVQFWLNNNKSLLMEMATGTGKTRTAIGCMLEQFKQNEPICVFIATPQITLSQQWAKDLEDLEIELDKAITVPGTFSAKEWKRNLELCLLDLSSKRFKRCVVFTTHDTASSDDFISIVESSKFNSKYMFIADEVHAIGSVSHQKSLLDCYDYRVGLSATPDRMFDEYGTEIIKRYFGSKSFEFTIADALRAINPLTNRPFLNNFQYYPIFVELTENEMERYNQLTHQIIILMSHEDYDPKQLQRLNERRARITKDASNKLIELDNLLDKLNPPKINNTIIFVSDKQIEPVFDILTKKSIKRAKITEEESANRIVTEDGETERQCLIRQFKDQQLQVLVGMKCLDEGIDIKNARIAVLMSNSTNPREYVQRVGRVIRPAEGKEDSEIYDFIVVPPQGQSHIILEKESRRVKQIAINATNYRDVVGKFIQMGVDLNAYQ